MSSGILPAPEVVDSRPGFGENLAAKIGLRGVSDAAFPAFTIPGYATLGNPTRYSVPNPIHRPRILDSLSWSRGKHAFKFGAEVRRGANDEIADRESAGNLHHPPVDSRSPRVSGTGNALASFLLGE